MLGQFSGKCVGAALPTLFTAVAEVAVAQLGGGVTSRNCVKTFGHNNFSF